MIDSCLAVGLSFWSLLWLLYDLHQMYVFVLFLWPGRFGHRESRHHTVILGVTVTHVFPPSKEQTARLACPRPILYKESGWN